MSEKTAELQKIIDSYNNIVFFGGAGVSTESGIPDFRSVDGLYNQKYDYPPERMLSHSFFLTNTEDFYRFYKDKVLALDAEPNAAHLKLAEMEAAGKLKAVITQNIDGLHQKARSKVVYELHGSVHRNFCTGSGCRQFYDGRWVSMTAGVPKCERCGRTVKPDVVLYEEGLDQDVIEGAVKAIRNAEVLIVGGTSLVVYPAAGLLQYFRGEKIVLINKGATSMDRKADLLIQEPIGEVLRQIRV